MLLLNYLLLVLVQLLQIVGSHAGDALGLGLVAMLLISKNADLRTLELPLVLPKVYIHNFCRTDIGLSAYNTFFCHHFFGYSFNESELGMDSLKDDKDYKEL